MDRQEQIERILNSGLVAIIRSPSSEQLVQVAEAIYEGGIDIIEVTFTVTNVVEILKEVHQRLGDRVLLGAGTVLDTETARAAMLAGAEFIVSPTTNVDLIHYCNRYSRVIMPGAFTPTEVLTAWEAGADFVKIFPADVGGPSYLKAIHGPLPQVRLMPTGGVNLQTMESFMKAGACAVGLGSALLDQNAIREGNFSAIRDRAAEYVTLRDKIRRSLHTS